VSAHSASIIVPDTGAISNYFRLYEEALEACPEARLVLFALPGKLTFASRDVNLLINKASAWCKQGRNVYLHIHGHTLPEGGVDHRGRIETASVAIGLFSDIDAVGPGRKKPGSTLCRSVEDAIAITEEFNARFAPLRISVLLCSGYGCYPVLLFQEPLVIATPADRALLESLGRRYHEALHCVASQHGWTGAVERCDLAKVLRLLGMINFKDPANPKAVRLLCQHDVQFTLMDLDELLPPEPKRIAANGNASGLVVGGGLILDPGATPPAGKFEFLCELEPDFARIWAHKRKLRDQSQSGYDLALAYRAAWASFTDQEIVNTLIANRRVHGGKPKLRLDYYLRTIALARASAGAAAPSESELDYPDANAGEDHGDGREQHGGPEADRARQCPVEAKLVEADPDPPEQDVDHEEQHDRQDDGVPQPTEEPYMEYLETDRHHPEQEQHSSPQGHGVPLSAEEEETPAGPDSTGAAAGDADMPGATAAPNQPATDPQSASRAAGANSTGPHAPSPAAVLLAMLSQKLGLQILGLRRLNSEPAQYRLLAERGGEQKEVKLGDVTQLISQTKFRNRIADAIGYYVPRFDIEDWDPIAAQLLKACEPEDLGEEATDLGQVDAWITGYLTDQHIHASVEESLGDNGANDSSREPFRDEGGAIWIRSEGLQEWLRVRRGEKVKLRILTAAFRDAKFERKKFPVEIDNKPSSRMAWKVPAKQ
jgi:hypothetical protein